MDSCAICGVVEGRVSKTSEGKASETRIKHSEVKACNKPRCSPVGQVDAKQRNRILSYTELIACIVWVEGHHELCNQDRSCIRKWTTTKLQAEVGVGLKKRLTSPNDGEY